MPQVQGSQVGLWAENTLGFAEDAFRLTPGIRYDYFSQRPVQTEGFIKNKLNGLFSTPLDASLPASATGSAFSPKILAEWSPDKRLHFLRNMRLDSMHRVPLNSIVVMAHLEHT